MVVAHKHNINVGLGNQYKNGSFGVRIRVTYGGNRTDLYTRLSATKQQWDSNRQRYKQGCIVNGIQYNLLNSNIDDYINYINDYFNKASLREVMPSLSELKKQFNYSFKQSAQKQTEEFFFVFQTYIESRPTGNWTDSYKAMFKRLGQSLKKFKPDIKFSEFNAETMNKYLQYLSLTMRNDKIAKVLSMLREFMTYADRKNYPVCKEFFEYKPKLPQSKKDVRYLSIEELQTIINLKLEKGSALDMTRDFFVFQCFTALRYCDFKNLKHDNIREVSDGKYEIDIVTEKDNDRIPFPLSKVATSIYCKYKDNIYDNGVVFPVVSNQKYNKRLKELGRQAGIQGEWTDYQYRLDKIEEIKIPKAALTSHTARRTFVVTALNEGIPLDLVAQITSHADVDIMRPYIAATNKGKQTVISALDRVITERD